MSVAGEARDDLTQDLEDLQRTVRDEPEWSVVVRDLFRKDREVSIARAPGRLDVMGGIADYSGSLVLQWPLREATLAVVQKNDSGLCRIASPGSIPERSSRVEFTLAELRELATAEDYTAARERFQREPRDSWAAYGLGGLVALLHERNATLEGGVSILLFSRVPEARGVSSSAAVEVSTVLALSALCGVEWEGRDLALLCQRVENHIAGAACGIMDQLAVTVGVAGHVLPILCQPAEVRSPVALPSHLGVWGIDSGLRHEVGGSDYTSVRTGAFLGYRMLTEKSGFPCRRTETPGIVEIEDSEWGGYLANLSVEEFERRWCDELPERVNGGEFLQRWGGFTDPVTRIDRDRDYAVREPTAHPVRENDRVHRFLAALAEPACPELDQQLGRWMFESHDSYGTLGLGSTGTDRIVELVKELGEKRGLLGARITGGGSGGCVAVLARAGAGEAVHEVARAYAEESGLPARVFAGSSPGAWSTGVVRRAALFR